ncbi:uncharacterized protein FFMR_15800 [Fusarium fujikuroi]|nr:uncharacterized protein FFC1_15689 [Fusarium fujikuroi]SCO53835.1 uncharacterized protein FFNC_15211 [Fusarium fujikuroi]SCO58644.1 uncharacterized protein FFMR_15800 [Fusarium fujikuroi]
MCTAMLDPKSGDPSEFPIEITPLSPPTLFGFFDEWTRRENKKRCHYGQQNKTQRPRVRDLGQWWRQWLPDHEVEGLPSCWHTNQKCGKGF